MKLQTKLNPLLASQVQDIISYTGLDLNTIVRVALQEYCQRQRVSRHNAGEAIALQPITSNIPLNPLKSLDNSPPIDNNTIPHKVKLLWPEWSQLNPGKSNDEFMQYFMGDMPDQGE